MRRGINVGNFLDVDPAHDPVRPVTAEVVDIIAAAGFDTVRIPVRWSAHASSEPPFPIDPGFFTLVDAAIDAVRAAGLDVIIDAHHDRQLNADPAGNEERFLAGWSLIARRYADHPDGVAFELLNEPDDQLTPSRWNQLLRRVLAVVRRTNPTRTVLIGPAVANTLVALDELELPADDHVVATIHYYEPFAFTHQNAPWLPTMADSARGSWGSPADVDAVVADVAALETWAARHEVPVFVGEFGTYEAAPMAARAGWTSTVRRELERLGIGWCYWDLATDFGAYDETTGSWREALRRALLDRA